MSNHGSCVEREAFGVLTTAGHMTDFYLQGAYTSLQIISRPLPRKTILNLYGHAYMLLFVDKEGHVALPMTPDTNAKSSVHFHESGYWSVRCYGSPRVTIRAYHRVGDVLPPFAPDLPVLRGYHLIGDDAGRYFLPPVKNITKYRIKIVTLRTTQSWRLEFHGETIEVAQVCGHDLRFKYFSSDDFWAQNWFYGSTIIHGAPHGELAIVVSADPAPHGL